MTKYEYLIELAKKLEALNVNKDELYPETRRLVGFYQEMIEDRMEEGLSEEEAVAKMEPVDEIVARVKREFTMPEIVVNADEPADEPRSSGRAVGKYTYMTKAFDAKAVRRVSLQDTNRSIRIVSGDELKIEYVDGPDGHYDVDVTDGVLTARFVSEAFGLRFLFGGWRTQDTTFTLTLPKGYGGELDIRTSNGSVSAAHLSADSVLMRSSNGKITIEHAAIGERLKVVTSNGGIRLKDISAVSVTAQSSNARVESERIAAEEVVLTTSNGANEAREIAAVTLRVETRNGHVSVDRVTGESISLASSNGAITGTIKGEMSDYAITSRTSNGKNNLPPVSEGAKKLDVRTSNARIDIRFAQ